MAGMRLCSSLRWSLRHGWLGMSLRHGWLGMRPCSSLRWSLRHEWLGKSLGHGWLGMRQLKWSLGQAGAWSHTQPFITV